MQHKIYRLTLLINKEHIQKGSQVQRKMGNAKKKLLLINTQKQANNLNDDQKSTFLKQEVCYKSD